jgi:hypothetical protein
VGIYSADPASGLTALAQRALLVGSVDAVLMTPGEARRLIAPSAARA